MLTITYLITVYNKERYIGGVIDSLKKIEGLFNKQFIFVNDGSTDNSLNIIRRKTFGLSNVTIINQPNKGPSKSTNIGIDAAKGDYVQFADGDDIIAPNSTKLLTKAANAFDCDVAFGIIGTYNYLTGKTREFFTQPDVLHISRPIIELAKGKISGIRKIGSSGSLVKTRLLKQIGGCDESVFIQDFSLSLRCAKLSKFVKLNQTVCYCPEIYDEGHISFNTNFEKKQSLLTLMRFLEDNQDLQKNEKEHLYKSFWSIKWKLKKDFCTFVNYIKSKISSPNLDMQELKKLYDSE